LTGTTILGHLPRLFGSKLYVTALAFAVAREMAQGVEQRSGPRLGADEDGRPRRAGRPRARSLDADLARDQRRSAAKVSGAYWHHRQQRKPAAQSLDPKFQDELVGKLAELTGTKVF